MSPDAKRDPAADAWEAMFRIVFSERPPRIPAVAHEFDISPMVVKVLFMLEPGTEIPMRRLAEALCCDASNVTGIVDRLEQRAVIERREDPSDRRIKRLALTGEGRALRSAVLERLFEPPAAITALSGADRRALRDILQRAAANAERKQD